MDNAIDQEIKSEYLDEAVEIVEETEELLLKMEEAPDSRDIHDQIFRYAHTLKGSGFAAGFDCLAEFTHIFESLLGNIRSGDIPCESHVVDVLLKANDAIKIYVGKLKVDHDCMVDFSVLKAELEAISNEFGITEVQINKPSQGFVIFDEEEDDDEQEQDKNVRAKAVIAADSVVSDKTAGSTVTQTVSLKSDIKVAPGQDIDKLSSISREVQKQSTVLILDDDPDVLLSLQMTVEDEGYIVLGAGDGVEALKIIAEEKVDLVLSDLKMPKMDGMTFVKKIRETDVELPIIMISGFAVRSDLIKFFNLGVFDFIEKPFDVARVTIMVKNALRLRSLREQILVLGSLNFRIHLSLTRYWNRAHVHTSDPKLIELESRIREQLDELAFLSRAILKG